MNISWSKLKEYAAVATSSVIRFTSRTRRIRLCSHPVGVQHVGNPSLPSGDSHGHRPLRHLRLGSWFPYEPNTGTHHLPLYGHLDAREAGPGAERITANQNKALRTGRAATVELDNGWETSIARTVGFSEGKQEGPTHRQLPLVLHRVRGGQHDGRGLVPLLKSHPSRMTRRPWSIGRFGSYRTVYAREEARGTFGSRVGRRSSNRLWDH